MSNEITPNENVDDDIDSLLSGYNTQLKEQPDNIETETVQTETVNTEIPNPNAWQGDLNYFQTGSKAGQLKKKSKHHEPPKENMQISGTLIDGALFIMLIDLLFPLIIVMINNNFTKSRVNVEDLQLSEKQKKDLSPVADEAAKYLTLQGNPVWMLAIAMTGIYGINFMAAKQSAKR